jgi:uncharacterized protein with von Willebrand factor type A (vWA) domain
VATLNTPKTRRTVAQKRPARPQLPPQVQSYTPSNFERTHQGGIAARIPLEQQLRRSVCSCLLWEDEFQESGESIAQRIVRLARMVPPGEAARLAIDARSHLNLRHVPLLLLAALAAPGAGKSDLISRTLEQVIQRADEITEFLAIYSRVYGMASTKLRGRLSAQVKKGLGLAFRKFDAYQLARYFNQSGEKVAPIKARDVLMLCRPHPLNRAQAGMWKRILENKPIVKGGAHSWEVESSRGVDETVRAVLKDAAELGAEGKMAEGRAVAKVLRAAGISKDEWTEMRRDDKKSVFERQLKNGKLGYLALLRNLRSMTEAKVDRELIEAAILARRGAHRVFPFRYIAAARACPQFEGVIDQALSEAIAELPALPGRTVVLVDVSGSMDEKLSGGSDLMRIDAAAALASLMPGDLRVFTFSNLLVEVPRRFGMAGVQAIIQSQQHGGTQLGMAMAILAGGSPYSRIVNGRRERAEPIEMDRLIVITDEQVADKVSPPVGLRHGAYMINVASAKNGVGYGDSWTHLDGFSEQVIRWIAEFEKLETREAA